MSCKRHLSSAGEIQYCPLAKYTDPIVLTTVCPVAYYSEHLYICTLAHSCSSKHSRGMKNKVSFSAPLIRLSNCSSSSYIHSSPRRIMNMKSKEQGHRDKLYIFPLNQLQATSESTYLTKSNVSFLPRSKCSIHKASQRVFRVLYLT